jgi:glycosyltransferase involved in cell wall biosynthesis
LTDLISIIVPVFNEQATVAAVIARLIEIELPAPREIIVVNDGSSDGTRAVLDGLAVMPAVTVIHAARNRGKGHAIRLGVARARGTVVAIQDADLELDPAQIAMLVEPILRGTSAVIYGSRFLTGRPAAPWTTILANRGLTALTNIVYGSSITDMETCYKIMRADVVKTLELTSDRFDIEPEITARLLTGGHRIDERPVTFTPRSRAAGKKIGWRDAVVAVRVLIRLRPRGAFLTRAWLLLAITALLGALALAMSGGLTIDFGAFRVRAHSPAALAGVTFVAIALALIQGRDRLRAASAWWWTFVGSAAAPLACAVAIVTIGVGWAWGAHVAGGSDSYCYLNEAELFATGRVRQLQPLAVDPPWPDAGWSFVPAGHAPGRPAGAVVPICPAGYPLILAAAKAVAGRSGMFAVVPILGGIAVWLMFVLSRRLGGSVAGVMGAGLLASSPVFLYQVVQPMSDVPALALWLASLSLAWRAVERPGWRRSALCGAMTGAAVLVRPNLVPLAAIVALWIAASRKSTVRERGLSLAAFGTAALPFALVVMAMQNAMYGGPLKSGYGALGALFTFDHVLPNLLRYPRWLLETETPFVALALAAPWVGELRNRRSETCWLLAFAAATLVCYLPYVVFDAWWYLRFVLPAIAVLLALSAAVAVDVVSRLPRAWRTPALALAYGVLVVFHVTTAAHRQVFELRDLESRYRIAGEYVAAHLPPDAAVLTVHQSGSVRFYSGRPTLVWADLDPASLDRALEYLRSRNLRPFLLFETWEEPDFRRRFGAKSATGRLEWPPMAEIDRQIRIYDPAQYAPFIRGESVRTDQVWTRRR